VPAMQWDGMSRTHTRIIGIGGDAIMAAPGGGRVPTSFKIVIARHTTHHTTQCETHTHTHTDIHKTIHRKQRVCVCKREREREREREKEKEKEKERNAQSDA
jgi:hypothetical protein